ncbi:hypothetical protein F4813DRAFT_387023 [Daldinia decipiens]|uniref:uncharacterized protein n=1 Tax=Daldinia decipiens TaxID=326647 RepID=UPI0020C5A275|nr:uncharacterized protein F4813DRAFT_387023 [Daldinia decipiens]KAI1660155.1 hypothetical protein F4813DRAFT_387023 [Daldinia decipiens]
MSNPSIKQIYRFPTEFIENVLVLPNGKLLLSTFKSPGPPYIPDPTATEPQAKPVASFDKGITGLTGIVPLENGLYAVSGGLHTSFSFQRGSMKLFTVSLQSGKVVDSIPVPDTATMNGLAILPYNPHVVLSADSIEGRIFAIDTHTREVSVIFENIDLGSSG